MDRTDTPINLVIRQVIMRGLKSNGQKNEVYAGFEEAQRGI